MVNSNLIRTHIGDHYLIWRNDWDYGKVIEVQVLAKAYNQVKVRAISSGYFGVGAEQWLPTDIGLKEHWIVWGKAPSSKESG